MTLDSVAGVGRSKARVLGKQAEACFLSLMSELAALPLGARQLRQAVLNLAIRGRLAPQRSADEPVDALLRRVGERRSFLVAKKHATSCESLAPVTDEEEPYSVPAGWSWVRLGLTSICRDAQRVPVSKEQRLGRKGRFAYYGASGAIDTIDDYIFDGPLLLVGEDGANLVNRSTPIAFIADGQYWVNNHAHVLDGADIDHLRYLSLFINATDLVPYVTGTAQPKMNQAKMNMIPVALPPLAEQKRIVTKVDQLMALCDDLEAKQTKKRDNGARFTMASLDALLAAETSGAFDAAWKRVWKDFQLVVQRRSDVPSLRSAIVGLACGGWLSATARTREWGTGADLVEAILQSRRIERAKLLRNGVRPGALPRAEPVQFSEPASRPGLPPSWTLCGIDDLLACVPNAMKAGPFGSALTKSMYVPTGYKVYGQEQVISGDHRVGSYYVDRAKFESLRSCAVAPGDMLVSLMGTIGKVLILPNDCEPGIINPRLLKLSIHSSVSPDYIRLCLQSPQSQRFLMESARGVAMDGLNIGILRALPIALPPLPEQLWLLERVEILLKLLDDLEAKLRKQEETATHLAESLAAAVAG